MEDYKIGNRYVKKGGLGSGTYGKIFLARDLQGGPDVVVKEVEMTRLEQYQKDQAIKEVKFMKTLDHPNIVAYREFFYVEEGETSSLYIIMEFAAGLVHYIHHHTHHSHTHILTVLFNVSHPHHHHHLSICIY